MENFISGKKKLEETFVNKILNYLKDDTSQILDTTLDTHMKCYNFVTSFAMEYTEAEDLYNYHSEILEKSMAICFEKIKDLEGLELIDSFIKCTKKLNLIINTLSKDFSFLNFYYVKFSKIKELDENSMDIYKKSFFI